MLAKWKIVQIYYLYVFIIGKYLLVIFYFSNKQQINNFIRQSDDCNKNGLTLILLVANISYSSL